MLAVLCCYGCNSPVDKSKGLHDTSGNSESKNTVTVKDSLSPVNNKLIGIWTDGRTENATFDIRKDSIYYVEQMKSYRYSTRGDSIKIYYEDYTFNANVYFIKDTLAISSEEGGQILEVFKLNVETHICVSFRS